MDAFVRVLTAALLVIGLLAAGLFECAYADLLWSENAENGYSEVLDNTAASYPLIQSDIVGEGNFAFHLANPSFQDNWFGIDETLTIQPDTKLFLLSRLTYASDTQVAKVQISTNGGSTWPTSIYSQAGSNGPGEGAFSLKAINLAAYAGQSLRFRFYYDFTGTSGYPHIDPGVGWYIDDIQIGDKVEKIQYSIGDPSDDEQLYLEYINRARTNAMAEANRLASETDPDITSAYASFGITGTNIVNQFQTYVNDGVIDLVAQPLSFNAALNLASDLHTQDMFEHRFQGHASSSDPPPPLIPGGDPGDRFDAVDYNFVGWAENVYTNADSVREGHAAFDVDWGNSSNSGDPDYYPNFVGQGMQNPAGHRRNIHNGSYKEIGIGVINDPSSPGGRQLVTQDFGNPGSASFITGVVYEDLNSNNFYDVGEGRSGVRVDVEGSAYYTVSTDSGGYSVPVVGNGTYDVLFSGGGFNDLSTTATITGGRNAKLDYLVSDVSYAADFDGDNDVDGVDLQQWEAAYGVNALGDADEDGDSDGFDFLIWQQQYGSGVDPLAVQLPVPEPSTCLLGALTGCWFVLGRRLARWSIST